MSVQEMAPYDEYVVVLGNVRAEIARRRLSQSDIAREMGQTATWRPTRTKCADQRQQWLSRSGFTVGQAQDLADAIESGEHSGADDE